MTSPEHRTPELVRDLLRPAAWPMPTDRVELIETNISRVFLGHDHVFKVKKPVRFDFLDFSTLERREQACRDELRLDRRLAPDVYLDVLPVTRGDDGRLRFGGEGDPEDWAVLMRRLPAEGMLDRLLERGALDDGFVRELAELLAHFHDACARGPDVECHGTADAVTKLVLGNTAELQPFVDDAGAPPRTPAVLSARLLRFLQERLRYFLVNHADLLRQRVARGHIVEGHGDLHAANICRTEHGIVIYDALEFSHALRCGDVANDLAFLAMDLDRRGFFAFSRHVVKEYVDLSLDPSLPTVLTMYKTHRALVRAKVRALGASAPETSPERAEELHRDGMAYAALAASYHLRPCLLLTCGLPGTGKSWIGRRLATALDARMVRSDTERKVMAGIPPTEAVPKERVAEVYGAEWTSRLHERLRELAVHELRAGRSIVVDATFGRREDRAALIELAEARGTPWLLVHVDCPADEVRARLEARAGDRSEISDADWHVYRAAAERFEAPDEILGDRRVPVRSPAAIEDVLACVVDHLLAWQGA